MAHEIDQTTGTASMFYVRPEGLPWHGLGTGLDAPATSAEAIVAAGLDYPIFKEPMYISADGTAPGFGGLLTSAVVPDSFAVVRGDTRAVLGVVGNQFSILQNRDAFGFMDTVANRGIRYHTAGGLNGGRRVWILGKLTGNIMVKGADQIDKFLLLSNAHDGTGKVRVFFTPVRVVCANTLAQAMSGRRDGVEIKHTGDISAKLDAARDVLGIARAYYDDFADVMDVLASARPTTAQVKAYFATLYGGDEKGKVSSRTANIIERNMELFEDGRGQNIPETRRTVFSAYQAVTEYATHERGTRVTGGKEATDIAVREARLEANWFGTSADLNVKALSLATELAHSILN